VSAWLQRARSYILAYQDSCGGEDMLSGGERTLVNRASMLVDELSHIEAALQFIGLCDVCSVAVAELLGEGTVVDHLAATSAARQHYFRQSGELRFQLRCMAQRMAKAAA
jgi:hypothetical protein